MALQAWQHLFALRLCLFLLMWYECCFGWTITSFNFFLKFLKSSQYFLSPYQGNAAGKLRTIVMYFSMKTDLVEYKKLLVQYRNQFISCI